MLHIYVFEITKLAVKYLSIFKPGVSLYTKTKAILPGNKPSFWSEETHPLPLLLHSESVNGIQKATCSA